MDMKNFIVVAVILVVLGICGYAGYELVVKPQLMQMNIPSSAGGSEVKTTTAQGKLIKIPNPKDDYTHTLKTSDKLVRVASYSVPLDDYNNNPQKNWYQRKV